MLHLLPVFGAIAHTHAAPSSQLTHSRPLAASRDADSYPPDRSYLDKLQSLGVSSMSLMMEVISSRALPSPPCTRHASLVAQSLTEHLRR